MARLLVLLGIALVMLGLLWPWLARLGLGRLPGDILIERNGLRFYFPITTSILVSVVLSAVATLLVWLFRK